jgi:enoyl-CoA hydratase/carnithine racemase
MADLIETDRQGRLLRITLNRPDKRNALNIELCRQLVVALERAAADAHVGAVLLTAKGKAFCAGMDLTEVLAADTAEIHRVQEQLFTIGVRSTIPVVAAVHGAALAGGTGLVANCHVVVAAEDALFGLTEVRIGLWPFLIFRPVAAAVGERRAVELALTGRTFGAWEARDYGLVHEIAAPADLEQRAAEIGFVLANSSPTAVRSGLMFVQEIQHCDWRQVGEIARLARNRVFEGPDFHEGVRAFQEKRAPQWPSLGK